MDKYDGFMYKHMAKQMHTGLSLVKSIVRSDKYKLNDARLAARAFMPKWEELSLEDDNACQQFVTKVTSVCNFIQEWEYSSDDKTERKEVIIWYSYVQVFQ